MNVCENEAVIAFDTLYTQNHIQILKILLPYFDPYGQSHLAVWIKYLELRYTLEYVSRHPSPPYKNQTSGTSSPDFAVLFEQIKNFCSPREKALFGELLNLQKNLELFKEMKGMMQLFETLRESAHDADADTAADADCSGTNPDILKQLQEQAARRILPPGRQRPLSILRQHL